MIDEKQTTVQHENGSSAAGDGAVIGHDYDLPSGLQFGLETVAGAADQAGIGNLGPVGALVEDALQAAENEVGILKDDRSRPRFEAERRPCRDR